MKLRQSFSLHAFLVQPKRAREWGLRFAKVKKYQQQQRQSAPRPGHWAKKRRGTTSVRQAGESKTLLEYQPPFKHSSKGSKKAKASLDPFHLRPTNESLVSHPILCGGAEERLGHNASRGTIKRIRVASETHRYSRYKMPATDAYQSLPCVPVQIQKYCYVQRHSID